MATGSRPSLRARLLVAAVSPLLALLLAEALLALVGPEIPGGAPSLAFLTEPVEGWTERGLQRDPDLPWSWVPVPGGAVTASAPEPFSYDRRGFRGSSLTGEKSQGTIRIVCMGDSCTLGWGCGEGKSYPDQLARQLEERYLDLYEVVNAGVSGYSSFQGLHQFTRVVEPLKPDLIVASYNWNDHGAAMEGLAGDPWPDGPPPPRFTDRQLPGSLTALKLHARLGQMRTYRLLRAPLLLLKGRLEEAPGPTLRVPPADYRANLLELARRARAASAGILFFTQAAHPDLHRRTPPWDSLYELQDQYNELMRETAQAAAIPCLDVVPVLWSEPEAARLWIDHVHLSPAGNRRLAELLAPALLDLVPPPAP